ncbi:hypothetical protein D3C87_703130 [compost metagenome]
MRAEWQLGWREFASLISIFLIPASIFLTSAISAVTIITCAHVLAQGYGSFYGYLVAGLFMLLGMFMAYQRHKTLVSQHRAQYSAV